MLSIAVFGSIARKDGDYLSDRDVLIVSDDLMRLQRHRCRWEASGWSVAGYSWAKLNNIADKDGLFIKHLRDEARIYMMKNKLWRIACEALYQRKTMT